MDDADMLLEWKNEEDTRMNSIATTDKINYSRHIAWLADTLESKASRLMIIEDDGVPAGDVRLDYDLYETEVSIRLDKKYRGKGLATAVIGMIREEGMKAKIRAHNLASMRVFISNGFKPYEYYTEPVPYYVFKK